MATLYKIEMDYRAALLEAEALERAAKRVGGQREELQRSEGQIRACWQGEDAELYIGKMQKTEHDMKITEKNLYRAASVTRGIAEKVYLAEKRAIEIANIRKYR